LTDGVNGVTSPSLWPVAAGHPPAFEMKFLVTEEQVRAIEQRLRGVLTLDPHGDPALDHAYRTTTLYCDTAGHAVFHRLEGFRRRKHRLRRYGTGPGVFLERKTKWSGRVRKQRTLIPGEELSVLGREAALASWPGFWFHDHLLRRRLRPVCRMSYERVAHVGTGNEGPLRVTFDRHIRGVPCREWSVEPVLDGLPVLTGRVICELKFRAALPMLFKEIIHDLTLTPAAVSKYRSFLLASGQVPTREAADA
jgi:hypothetical protein